MPDLQDLVATPTTSFPSNAHMNHNLNGHNPRSMKTTTTKKSSASKLAVETNHQSSHSLRNALGISWCEKSIGSVVQCVGVCCCVSGGKDSGCKTVSLLKFLRRCRIEQKSLIHAAEMPTVSQVHMPLWSGDDVGMWCFVFSRNDCWFSGLVTLYTNAVLR